MSLAAVENVNEVPRSPSPEYLTQEELNQAIVYSNDNIMEKILSHVSDFQDRLSMKCVSHRFQKLLERSGIVPPNKWYGHLSLTIPAHSSRISVYVGSFWKFYDGLTYTGSIRQQPDEEQHQTEELMDILQKLLFAKDIVTEVTYGGCTKDMYYLEDNGSSLVITKDLFEHLENFKNLKSLKLDDSYLDKAAIDYLESDECKFKYRIEDLKICTMSQDTWILSLMHKNLRNLTVRRLFLEKAPMYLKRIEELDLHLDTMNFEISNVPNFEFAREIFSKLTSRCKKLYLSISSLDYQPSPNLLLFARNINLWTNITSLNLRSKSHSIRDAVDMSVIFENIACLRKLERLTITEHIKTDILVFLTKGIKDLKHLKYLNLSDRAKQKDAGVCEDFMENLPLTLEEIKLDGLTWDHGALEAFSDRFSGSLKRLTVTRPRNKSYSKLFTTFAQKFTKLTFLEFYNPVPWQLIHYVIENRNLDEVNMFTSNSIPPKAEIVLQDHFIRYRKECYSDGYKVTCTYRKKKSTLKLPLYPIVTRFRRPRLQKEDWTVGLDE